MAKILPGRALAGASGRIGNLVTYNLKGTQVVRALPETSKKRKTSPLQEQHIKSFKIQHAIAKSVKKTIIDKIWLHLPLTGGMNPYNQFIKRNRAPDERSLQFSLSLDKGSSFRFRIIAKSSCNLQLTACFFLHLPLSTYKHDEQAQNRERSGVWVYQYSLHHSLRFN